MTRATTVVITSDPTFGSECQHAFRHASIFPIVVSRVDRAVSLLREFRADVIVLVSDVEAADDQRTRISEAAAATPLLVFATLPPPAQLAAAIREALDRSGAGSQTTPP